MIFLVSAIHRGCGTAPAMRGAVRPGVLASCARPGPALRRASPGRGGPDGRELIARSLALALPDGSACANARGDASSTASVSSARSHRCRCAAVLVLVLVLVRRATRSVIA